MTGETLLKMVKFGAVGAVGYVVDAIALALAMPLVGPYLGRAISYIPAVTTTFLLNRSFTFGVTGRENFFKQYWAFFTASILGGLVNFAVYSALIAAGPKHPIWPFVALAIGVLAGAVLNFTLSNRLVFGRAQKDASAG